MHQAKLRIAALLCALALLAGLTPCRAEAASSVYLTAINENVLELSASTMPFWSGDYLYAVSSVFSSSLGLSSTYNRARQLLVIWESKQPSHALFFTLEDGMIASGEGNNYSPGAILRNGQIFVPVSVLADYFGLTYTVIKVSYGHLIWVRTPDSALSGMSSSLFADAASYQMASRYAQYLSSSGQGGSAVDNPSPGADTAGRSVYLCFRVTDAAQTSAVLDALEQAHAAATFYLTYGRILASGDLLRRMAATGQSVGLIVDADADRPLTEQLRQANDALWKTIGGKTRLCFAENADDTALREIEAAGYRCLAPDLDRAAEGLYTASNANYLAGRVNARNGAVTVWLSDQISAAGVGAFARAAARSGDRLAGLTETV